MSADAIDAEIDYGEFEASDRNLRRDMSLTQLLFLGVSAQIGSGWLFAVLSAAGLAGPAAILGWIIASMLIFFVALAYAEIAAMMPRSGAIVRYSYLTHGTFTGWIIGWAYWLSAVSIPPIEAEAVITYLGGKFPEADLLATKHGVQVLTWPNGILAGIVLMLLFFALNYYGVRFLSESNRWVTLWKLLIPTITFCMLFSILDTSNFSVGGGFLPKGFRGVFHAIATSGIIFSLLGFRQALDYGGEVRNPQRNVPLATWGSIVIPMIFYTLLQIAFIGALNWKSAGLHPGQWGMLEGSKWADGPFFHALDASSVAALAAFGNVLLIDAAVSPAGTGWVYQGTATRTWYGLAVHRNIPPLFQIANRHGIPWFALALCTIIGCVFFVPTPSWYSLVGFISAAAVLTYVMGGVGLLVMRRTCPDLPRPFRLPAATFWAAVGFLAATLILYWGGFSTLVNVFTATFIGLPLFAWYYAVRRGWTAALPAALIGIVFLGAFVYVAVGGGWVLTTGGAQRAGGWAFGVYDGAFSAAVLFFAVAMWLSSSAEGRMHIQRSAWLLWLLLATFPLSYFGFYGPLSPSPIAFPYGMLIEIGIGVVAFAWGVRSGWLTDEMADIAAVARARAQR